MIPEETEGKSEEPAKSDGTRRRLAYPAIAIFLAYLIPGCALLLLVLDAGWGLFAPAYTNNWYVDFSFHRYWTPFAALLLGSAIVFASVYSGLWFRRPRWNVHFVTVFSVYTILFGIGLTIWILIFSFVIPTGHWFADGGSGPSSGDIYDSPLQLLISLPILFAGAYGFFISRWVSKHPALAHPSDVRDRPNELARPGWIRIGCGVAGCAIVFGILLSPAVSPLSYVHDKDGDGKADKVDWFPDDASFWAPVHLVYDVNESEEAFILTFLGTTYEVDPLPVADFYLSTYERHYDSVMRYEIVLDKESLGAMSPGAPRSGVTFFDNQQAGFLGPGDVLQFDKTVYERLDKYVLSDASGEVIYVDWVLEAF